MAEFRGVKCDQCGSLYERKVNTKRKVTLDGPKVSGEYTEDLCPECTSTTVPKGVTLRPLRRRSSPSAA